MDHNAGVWVCLGDGVRANLEQRCRQLGGASTIKMWIDCRASVSGACSLSSWAGPEHTLSIVSPLKGTSSHPPCAFHSAPRSCVAWIQSFKAGVFSPNVNPFFMLRFRSRKTRWPSEVLPRGACLTRIISEGLSVPMRLNGFWASLCSEWLLRRSQVQQSPTYKRLEVFLPSLNVTLLSSKDWTSCMALYLTQCQPLGISLEGQIYICFANRSRPLFMSKWGLVVGLGKV